MIQAVSNQWGFLLLDGVWTLVGLGAIARLVRGPAPA
jgi:hypothetical protein